MFLGNVPKSTKRGTAMISMILINIEETSLLDTGIRSFSVRVLKSIKPSTVMVPMILINIRRLLNVS